MRSWTKRIRDAEARGDTEAVRRITEVRETKQAPWRAEQAEAMKRQEEKQRKREEERKAAPFGRCAFSGEPLADPGELSYAQAEKRFGWAPCQVRYGRWPNGAQVKS